MDVFEKCFLAAQTRGEVGGQRGRRIKQNQFITGGLPAGLGDNFVDPRIRAKRQRVIITRPLQMLAGGGLVRQ